MCTSNPEMCPSYLHLTLTLHDAKPRNPKHLALIQTGFPQGAPALSGPALRIHGRMIRLVLTADA